VSKPAKATADPNNGFFACDTGFAIGPDLCQHGKFSQIEWLTGSTSMHLHQIARIRCRALISLILPLIIALVASSCASRTSVSSQWHDKSPANSKFSNVLVVGVSDNTDARMSFEDAVVYDLRGPNTQAWASVRGMGANQEINEENLRKLVDAKQVDAIVVVKVTSLEIKAVEAGGRTNAIENQQDTGMTMVPKRKPGTIFQYDYEETVEPVYTTAEYTTVLTTDVYSVASGKNVYTVVTSATKQASLADVIDILSNVIAERLRSDKVIR
jgi:hypothetical protein